MGKEKISITLDKALTQDIRIYAQQKKLSRSKIIEQVLNEWNRAYKTKMMIEGYKEMAKENLSCAKAYEPLSNEVWGNE